MKRFFLKTLKFFAILIPTLLLLMFLLPVLFPGPVVRKVKAWANQNIEGELDFSKVRLSFFNHFPSLTATLYDANLKGSAPFKKDTLIAAEEISLGINIRRLIFGGDVYIDKIFVSNAFVNVLVNKKGEANYNVYVAKEKSATASSSDDASLKLEKIEITNTRFIYDDKSVDILIDAKGFNYTGNGDLDKDIFDLYSHANIDSLNFLMGTDAYLSNKKVNADLITKINTHSLAFFFEKNDLHINKLPVQFSGKLDFLSNGYDMDFSVASKKSTLAQLITAMPPAYLQWLEKTEVKGNADVALTLKGKYITSANIAPTLTFDMKINNGYVNHNKSPFPASDIYLDLHTRLPSLSTDSLNIVIDSINFKAAKNYLQGKFSMHGLTRPQIFANLKTLLNLNEIERATGLNAGVSGNMTAAAIVNRDYYDISAKGKILIDKIFKEQGVDVGGLINADLHFKGTQTDAINGNYGKLNNSGTLTLKNIKIGSSYFPKSFLVKDGSFVFNQDKASFNNLDGGYGQSDFRLNGYFQNIINYLLFPDAVLGGAFTVNSNFINANELMTSDGSSQKPDSSSSAQGVFVVPSSYNLSLTAKANEVLYNDIKLKQLKTRLAIDTNTVFLDSTSFEIIGCKAEMSAKYKSINPARAYFDYKIKATDFDIKRAYDSVKLFRELATTAAYAQGIVSLDYSLKGVLNENTDPIYPSIEGGGTIYLKDVKVKGYKLFSVVSKQTGKDSVDNPNLKKVTIKSAIKNNIINIERFKFKVFGFRPRIEGQTSFDGQLNLKMRLGLPPLGIIGIPIKITGTQDEPVIKLGKKTEDLKETEYDEESI